MLPSPVVPHPLPSVRPVRPARPSFFLLLFISLPICPICAICGHVPFLSYFPLTGT